MKREMSQRRMLAEYNGKKDYERLLNKYFTLGQQYEQVRCNYVQLQMAHAEIGKRFRAMKRGLIVTTAIMTVALLIILTVIVLYHFGVL